MGVKLWLALHRAGGERGEVYIEYTILGALAVLVILAAVQYFFGSLALLFQKMGDVLRGIG